MSNKAIVIPEKNNVVAPVAASSPIEAYQMLLSNGGNLENIEKMMELQIRWEQMEAKKAYVQAMAAFKADPPKIVKDKKVGFKQTSYTHASLGNVTATINASLAKHGLSAAWATEQGQGGIKVTCTITHNLGHSESTSLIAGADTSGSKNSIQAIGSTITYLQRYTLLALTGLATHDQDDDGQSTSIQFISEKQVSEITDMMNEWVEDHGHFLKWVSGECCVEIQSVENIPSAAYGKVISALKGLKK